MIIYEIPGRENIEIENIVFDYNGTIAVDGKILEGVGELFLELEKYANLYILTADTYGTVVEQCKNIPVKILTFPKENAGKSKKDIVEKIGKEKTLAVGNGFNDIPMFKEATLSIAIIEGEGASGKLLWQADIVARNIIEAINIILDKNKLKATLRN
ncbi:P-type E1-E2 ATPase [Keratinibaculum paraultunense]|uniref:P-type E1-E2 ATPase n=1 Tax=Keratinibaculum paraultunense TaxID=1278232 RepID=A0A4R3KT24_9FIRM|nr:HAD family hydrolase [Keratinibaculum paraultunense]QQY79622.1 HAD hydrolase family protein [Keratinibaculum paraultunense]TCS87651.1 P-type E1-E2 ATPase [Keratinibaculum paraultunense]